MSTLKKTILAISLVATSQTYSMFKVVNPITQNSQHLVKRALLKRLMSTTKDSQVKQLQGKVEDLSKISSRQFKKEFIIAYTTLGGGTLAYVYLLYKSPIF